MNAAEIPTPHPAQVAHLDIDPFSDDFLNMPYPYHERMREAGSATWLEGYGLWAFARHEQVRAGLSDSENFISSAGVGLSNFRTEKPFRPPSIILEADPPQHTKTRAVLARIMSPRAMQQLRAQFQVQAESLIDRLIQEKDIDGIADLAKVYPLRVFPDAVGLSEDERETLLLYGDMVFNSFGPHNHVFLKSVERYEPVREWIMNKCRREELAPGGFGDLIYQAAENGELAQDEAPLLVRSLLSAGVDTTVNGIGNALYCLALFPEQYEKLTATPALARPAFEEALRFESPVQTFFRTVNKPVEFAGVQMRENDKVLFFLAAANRDGRQWKNPETFDIERKPTGHMAFGAGIHGCVGQAVARLEGELILTALATRVKRIELRGEPVRRLNNTLRALESLPLRLIPH